MIWDSHLISLQNADELGQRTCSGSVKLHQLDFRHSCQFGFFKLFGLKFFFGFYSGFGFILDVSDRSLS